MRLRLSLLVACLTWAAQTHAEDLKEIYQLAVAHDPTLQAAYAALQANRQALPQAIAQMLPNLSASFSTTGTSESDSINPLTPNGKYNTKAYGLTLNQPIFHSEFWAQLEQSRHQGKEAMASYLSSTQDLIIRVAKQYFAILAALDDLEFTRGQRKAFSREYEQAKQRFEVGLIAITDVETAKAKYDIAVADEISAQNAVANEYEKLREITGQSVSHVMIFPSYKKLNLTPPMPNEQETWVNTAYKQNWQIIAAQENAKKFKAAIGARVAGHFPTVDVQGNLQRSKSAPPFEDTAYAKSATLNVSIPLFASGAVIFRTQEAQARYDESLKQLEFQQRAAASQTRQAFRGVLTAISSVKALSQAVNSGESSLEAIKAAYDVGTRTIVDVLDAESNLLRAQRDHAKARYNYLLEGLLLKQAAGILTPQDLYEVNALISHAKNQE